MIGRVFRGIHWTDVALAVALTVVGVVDTLSADDYAGGRTRLTAALLLQTVPLVWRRTAPLMAVALSALGVGIEVAGVEAWGDIAGFFGYLTLAYAAPRWAVPRDRVAAGCVLAAGFVVHLAAQPHDGRGEVIGSIISAGVLTAAAWGFGTAMRSRVERLVSLEQEAEERARRWEDERRAVVEEERRRIARDLHDIVGHALAAISLSAGGAEQCVPPEADDVRTSLSLIRATSRDAAAEVRRLVGLLRTEDDVNETAPQPTLASLTELVERARGAGLRVDLECTAAAGVPLGVQLAVYRVVQEGLTNIARHAPGAAARVSVRDAGGCLEVEIENDRPLSAPASAAVSSESRGHGLVGLAERVALYGGDIRTHPGPDGTFLLAASVPLS